VRQAGISEQMYDQWKEAAAPKLESGDLKEFVALEEENTRLKDMLAERKCKKERRAQEKAWARLGSRAQTMSISGRNDSWLLGKKHAKARFARANRAEARSHSCSGGDSLTARLFAGAVVAACLLLGFDAASFRLA